MPRLPGTDGKAKMGKSLGNALFLSDSADVIAQKVMSMYTDPGHVHVHDPGKVEGNVVFMYLDFFDPRTDEVAQLKEHYQRGGLGDVTIKRRLIEVLNGILSPIRIRRALFAQDPRQALEIALSGTAKVQEVAAHTMREVKVGMRLDY
jgi:tryptophanyl-tRNA synthetase